MAIPASDAQLDHGGREVRVTKTERGRLPPP
jgi:hypothetical protein